MSIRVAAIIPAFNEEPTIGDVVEVLRSSPDVREVIVVCDGSTDKTAEVARAAGATVYDLPKNQGKGAAMLHGLAHTDASVIAFFDADLRGLTIDHVARLVLPVINGSRVMNVGLRDRGAVLSRLTSFLPLIGGERVMVRQVVEGVPPEYLQGFMAESALNYYCRSRDLPYGSVHLSGLSIRRKYEKVGWRLGMVQYAKMAGEIVGAMLAVRIGRILKRF